ncbi:fructosamine kinase PKL/CAK/FruK [Rickenella mellea]|uniref:protein-ribulosamine 3-kinase n=1 Tax=Rickenella mellea TaxID=50990 RepID=A0A4Y7QK37_9AGAM|nr:fructosamine kinase PKL/CAK/FruK [Rickenella mellea]
MANIPPPLIDQLERIEPSSNFTYEPPLVSSSSGATYYVKLGRESEVEQYVGEVESLKAINAAAPGIAPRVMASGVTDGEDVAQPGLPYFISEYKHMSGLTDSSATKLGERLATELHRYESTHGFGFHVPTFCGRTRLKNGWFDTWEACYSSMIGDLLHGLRDKGSAYSDLCEKGENVREIVIPNLLRHLSVKPVLMHGDLWSGNIGTETFTAEPVIFDPSSFYGHNEADLAIARIFGGIPRSFFTTYHQFLPKTEPVDQYELRVDLYELFHYLNHALLFGGSGYSSSAIQKMDRLLKCSI